jgi:thiol-disulfide isomerase/thioredoxin
MSPAFRPVLVVLAVLALMLAFSGLRKANTPNDNLPWRKDLHAAKQEAAAGSKPLLLYFTATWCGPCQAMARETWPQPQVATALASVIPVKIDVDEHPDIAPRRSTSRASPACRSSAPTARSARRTRGSSARMRYPPFSAKS